MSISLPIIFLQVSGLGIRPDDKCVDDLIQKGLAKSATDEFNAKAGIRKNGRRRCRGGPFRRQRCHNSTTSRSKRQTSIPVETPGLTSFYVGCSQS